MINIPDKMDILIQCIDDNGNTGTFLRSRATGKQFGDTYKSLAELLVGHEIKFCEAHNIRVLYPGTNQ